MAATTQTDIAVIGGGLSSLHAIEECAKEKNVKVTAILGNNFLEFPMSAAIILADPDDHKNWVCGNPKTFEVKGVNYVYGAVADVDATSKIITTVNGQSIQYKVLIVATGSKSPLLQPTPGASLAERFAEVKEAAAAIKAAQTVVVYGTGLVSIEIAGDIRARNPEKRIIMVSRDGTVLGSEAPELRARVQPVLEKMKIEVMKGTAPDEYLEPKLTAGTVPLSNGLVSELSYDVWIPGFAQGPNTHFLKESGALDARGRLEVNESLQSTKFREIFGAVVTTVPLGGHPISSRATAQAKTCAKNALLALKGAPAQKHVDKEGPPPMKGPMNVKIGHGKGGYLVWNNLGPGNLLCCMPCGGGFPFCPPPCCWCCAPGCATCLGTCGGKPESESASIFMYKFLLPKFLGAHGYKGAGEMPPEMQKMS
eukprot:CAMPEP_0178424244 /NCGR_PEP_ID=MMETSP0689_2-20121128/28109_1 /TAXON_ID=160604 /ORGANISM="Amphidinium massartii, Strain CS-259" /LENGTH=423 /DNA_ID=CAMNT_0020045873 /DNA_START=74 /DNA_END=1345 /DNA_ORIENTATION=+